MSIEIQGIRKHCRLALFALMFSPLAHATQPIAVQMDAAHWHGLEADSMGGAGHPEFATTEGFPHGQMTLKDGSAALDGLTFDNGTIEYDFKAIGEDAPGIQFRVSEAGGAKNAEEFYFRTGADCRASDDCVQYTPVIHGFMLWDTYPEYQHQAFYLEGWNHVRLVISGKRMLAYVNGLPEPALSVGELASGSMRGSIHLRGPATYANLVVTPGLVNGLSPLPTPDPTIQDRSIVRTWEVSDLSPIDALSAPAYADMPRAAGAWHRVEAERGGLVNLDRLFTAGNQPAAVNWLRTMVVAKQAGTRQVQMGWLGEAWIYVNGKLVGDAKNFYYPPSERRDPDGRLSLQNGTFTLPLRAGTNEVAIALYSQVRDAIRPRVKYGMGLKMRFVDATGLGFERGGVKAR